MRPIAGALARLFSGPAAQVSLGVALGMACGPALAAPQGGQVAGGQAAITQSGAHTQVNQASQRAIINWQSFGLRAGESIDFNQPNAAAAILNRVTGHDASAIFGRMTANGQVFLVNPNGVLFGRGAEVNVGSLLATTSNIRDADFMAGRLEFREPGRPGATVRNEGTITVAQGGFAALVAPQAANAGVITARLGKVALAAGDAFVLDLYGDALVNLVVDAATLSALTDANGQPLAARVDHTGNIFADGGRVELTAATVKRLVDNVINVSGAIRAHSLAEAGGVVSLRGDAHTRLEVAGSIDVAGRNARGGRIEATAGNVLLAAGAHLDASGDAGGGRVLIGGDWQGGGTLPNAHETRVERGARVDASARATGDGGTVVVWAQGDTRFEGAVAARGGALGGNGGQVEVSGKARLGFDGVVDAAAPQGRAGTLLLDPTNLVIDGAGGSDALPGKGPGDFTVKASALNLQLVQGTTVALQADQDITVNANAQIDGRVAIGGGASGVPGGGLRFDAGRDIAVNGIVVLNDGAFLANAGRNFTQAGTGAIVTGAGALEINAAAGLQASNLLARGAVKLTSSSGAVSVANAISGSATERSASLEVRGRDGVTLGGGALVAGDTLLMASAGRVVTSAATLDAQGAVTLNGRGGVDAGGIVTPGAVTLIASEGDVLAQGVAGAAGSIGAGTARAESLRITARGNVTLGGAALGAGGLSIDGSGGGGRAGAVTFTGSVFAAGGIQAKTTGNIALNGNAGLSSGGALTLDSSGGAVSTAGGKVQAGGKATLAGATVDIGAGGVEVTSEQDLAITATGNVNAAGVLATAGGTIDIASSGGGVTVNDIATWRPGATGSGTLRITAGTDVLLAKALGGPTSGYTTSDLFYQASQRPLVGRVEISAGRNVELNGLNLDGNTNANAGAAGLSVIAGERVISNRLIAVNKGGIVLRATGDDAMHGVYLGNSVYSRGFDTAAGKTSYAITIGNSGGGARGNLFLFDNTNESALVPATLGGSALVEIGKIVIANNVPNYAGDPLLRAADNAAAVTVAADGVFGLSTSGPLSLAALPGVGQRTSLEQAAIVRTDGSAGTGIGLMVQTFRAGSDAPSQVVPRFESECAGTRYEQCAIHVTGTRLILTDENDDDSGGGERTLVLATVDDSTDRPEPGVANPADWLVGFVWAGATNRDNGQRGTHAGFSNLISGGAFEPQLTTVLAADLPTLTGKIEYELRGSRVELSSSGGASTRTFVYSGVLETQTGNAAFDPAGRINSAAPGAQTVPDLRASAGSNAGFAGIGAFGGQQAGSIQSATGNGFRPPDPQTVPAPPQPPVVPPQPPEPQPPPPAPPVPPPAEAPPQGEPGELESTTAVTFRLPGDDPLQPAVTDLEGGFQLVLGGRPGAEADFGRGGPLWGSASDVFVKGYRVANNSDDSVCATQDLAERPPTVPLRQTGLILPRLCPEK
ncbi:MAG TPA: filamentous hemagglutinin N-terminal domain-containing protein [Burkholderiaceae bacterium]|nr:filamentous hemagglutinin N-terminal domain-containing protein [Burkholderiaceae bacterium]